MHNHINDVSDFYSVIIEGLLHCPFKFQVMDKKVFVPFEINNEFKTTLKFKFKFIEMEHDMRFYLKSNCI